ncbi:hypothetical protein [Marinospirillum perlucidum]|uniref:hypothetical protein n=1 Tax=Marinospirillum perlucidum TaxID=1982602 RepID=UPI000DF2973E|nr:hypothetical protein [Marinospirillum perlucidum]
MRKRNKRKKKQQQKKEIELPTPLPDTPKALGRCVYVQPRNVEKELAFKNISVGMEIFLFFLLLLFGLFGIYSWHVDNLEEFYLYLGILLTGLSALYLWGSYREISRVRVGYVCVQGVGFFELREDGKVVGGQAYRFNPATRMYEVSRTGGTISNPHKHWQLMFHESGQIMYTIEFGDIGRSGEGGYAAEDSPFRAEFLHARAAFNQYRKTTNR